VITILAHWPLTTYNYHFDDRTEKQLNGIGHQIFKLYNMKPRADEIGRKNSSAMLGRQVRSTVMQNKPVPRYRNYVRQKFGFVFRSTGVLDPKKRRSVEAVDMRDLLHLI